MANDIIHTAPFANGDFNVGFSDRQHIEDVLLAKPGDYKMVPTLGVNVRSWMNGTISPREVENLQRTIRLNLQLDGATNIRESINPNGPKIYVDATY